MAHDVAVPRLFNLREAHEPQVYLMEICLPALFPDLWEHPDALLAARHPRRGPRVQRGMHPTVCPTPPLALRKHDTYVHAAHRGGRFCLLPCAVPLFYGGLTPQKPLQYPIAGTSVTKNLPFCHTNISSASRAAARWHIRVLKPSARILNSSQVLNSTSPYQNAVGAHLIWS